MSTATAIDQTNHQVRNRAKSPKATPRQKAEIAKEVEKRSWYVSREATKRLAIHAAMEGRSQSDIVNELLESLNRFTLPFANKRADKGEKAIADTVDNGNIGQGETA